MTSGERAKYDSFGRQPEVPRAARVMVVDRDADTLVTVQSLLSSRNIEAFAVASADVALDAIDHEAPFAAIVDFGTTGIADGLTLLAALKRSDPDLPAIVLSAHKLEASAAQALALGASSVVRKPLSGTEFEVRLLSALAERRSPETPTLSTPLHIDKKYPLLLGEGQAMADVAALIRRVADTDVTILIRGESGTGKELVARAVAASSSRRDKPFVKVNCAAIPSELLESELFGYERGAFTSAVQHKPGKFEFANHGTMFLDEIGEISFAMQAKLLHVLQDGGFSRLGGNRDVHVDVRIVAATNRDLEAAVGNGQFRSDLFFRLNVIAITLPPLRERPDDVPLLMDHFLRKYSAQYNRPLLHLSADAERWFREYSWPGNVRELENAVKHAVILGTDVPVARELAAHMAAAQGARVNVAAMHDDEAAERHVAPAALHSDTRHGDTQHADTQHHDNRHDGNRHDGDRRNAASERRLAADTAELTPLTAVPALTPPVPAAVTAPVTGPLKAQSYSLKEVAREAARTAERELILQVLQRTRWNRKAAAAILSISYKALLYKIKENGLDLARQV